MSNVLVELFKIAEIQDGKEAVEQALVLLMDTAKESGQTAVMQAAEAVETTVNDFIEKFGQAATVRKEAEEDRPRLDVRKTATTKAMAKTEQMAESLLLKSDRPLSKAQAVAEILRLHPELYEQHEIERRDLKRQGQA